MKTREIWGTGNKSENAESFSLGGHKQRIPQVFLVLRCHQKRKTQVRIPDKKLWSGFRIYWIKPGSWAGTGYRLTLGVLS